MKQFFLKEWMLLTGIFLALFISIFCQLIMIYYMLQMVKASEKLEEEPQKIFEDWIKEYLKEKQRITNTSVYVDKKLEKMSIGKYKVTWIKHLSGQTLLLAVFLTGIGACKGIIEGQTLGQVLPFYIISLFGMYLHFSLSGIMDMEGKKKTIRRNLSDFLENNKTYLYTSYEMKQEKKEIEEKKNFFGEDEDLELKEIIREILA